MVSFLWILLIGLLTTVAAHKHGLNVVRMTKVVTNSLTALVIAPLIAMSAVDSTFQDQLKVIQALQTEQQKQRILDEEQRELTEDLTSNDLLIAKGIVSLAPTGMSNGVDPVNLPLGFEKADSLDSKFGNRNAAMIITAVGRNGPPVAARKLPLSKLQFPYVFELTDKDLIFPFTRDAWLKSPLSSDSIALTAILDADGVLSTPDITDRFGFAISDPIRSDAKNSNGPGDAKTKPRVVPLRNEAKISINLKSDGKDYTAEDIELLQRVDNELARMATATGSP